MSGLGDPAPLVNALTGPFVASKGAPGSTDEAAFYLAGVVTLFDAVAGTDTVETHFEALKQLAFADRIVLTKTDLSGSDEPEAGDTSLRANLRSLNAGADILDRRMVDLADLFAPRPYSTLERGEDVEGWLALEAVLAQEAGHNAPGETDGRDARHGKGIRTFSLTSDKPVSRHRLQCFLHLLQSSAGRRLLRVKGIVALEETPDEPLIVHAVQHVVSPPLRLSAWPDADRRTRLVFITEGIDPDPVKDLFRAVFDAAPFSFAKILKSTGRAVFAAIARPFSQFTNSSRRSQ